MPQNDGELRMEGARILFRNFTGRETDYNRLGDRNFCLALGEELAEELVQDGWNVKRRVSRDEGDPDLLYIKVNVKYSAKSRPPKIVMVTSKGRTELTEDLVELLDLPEIASVDLVVRPYHWTIKGETGISAYLKLMYVTIKEDEFELKYADIPEIGASMDYVDGEVVDWEPRAIES